MSGTAAGVYIEQFVQAADSAGAAFVNTVIQPLRSLCDAGHAGQIVILVDALDEAARLAGAETIVDLLANASGLPPQVRFVLSTRPDGAVLRHLEYLNIPYLQIDAGREENQQDVTAYLEAQMRTPEVQRRLLQEGVSPEHLLDRARAAARGNLLYLSQLFAGMRQGTQRLDALDDLPQGLDGIYCEFFRTRVLGRPDWWKQHRPVVGVLAAAQAPLTLDQIATFGARGRQAVRDVLLDMQQFLDPVQWAQGRYQLYHESVADFVADETRADEFWVDMPPVHGAIARHFLQRYGGDWLACDDAYGLRHLPTHLHLGGMEHELHELLLTYSWLQARLNETDVATLVADLDLASTEAGVALVRDALRMSAHVLSADKGQLWSQLYGRLLGVDDEAIRRLLSTWPAGAWLRPLRPSLAAPGGPLVRTLAGYGDWVNAVAVTVEGQRAVSASDDKTLKVWDVATGHLIATFAGDGATRACAVTGDGTIVAGDALGQVHFLRLEGME